MADNRPKPRVPIPSGYRQGISLAITYDPGQLPALISAVLALAGLILSFMVRRRRVFVRTPDGFPATTRSLSPST